MTEWIIQNNEYTLIAELKSNAIQLLTQQNPNPSDNSGNRSTPNEKKY